ncbi:MAG TPA: hypothetical protein DCM02_08540 [Flavobacterium sp.]|nr:hypothetical protein [Flavobacterium sp.]
MADWFKWYEDELDSPEFSAAWSECSYLLSVLVWVRTEATKRKTDRFRIEGKYFLIGLAQKLKTQEHEIKRALVLLKEINYIDIEDDLIVIVKNWERHQSKYLYERSRKQALQLQASQDVPIQYPHSNHNDSTKYSECTLREERRDLRDMKREEEKQSLPLKNKQIETFYKEIYSIFISCGIKLLKKSESLELLSLVLKRHNQESIKESLHLVLSDSKINIKYLQPFGLINFLERIETLIKPKPKPSPINQPPEAIKPLTPEERLKADEARQRFRAMLEQQDSFKTI